MLSSSDSLHDELRVVLLRSHRSYTSHKQESQEGSDFHSLLEQYEG
jgi:hypothetical protein